MGILSVGGLEHSQDGLNDKLSIQGGDPVLVDCLRANFASVGLDARVVNLSHELDLGGLERVVVREVQVHRELAADEWSAFRSVDDHVPDCDVVLRWLNRDSSDWCAVQVAKLLVIKNHNTFIVCKLQCFSMHHP